ncbi:MAG: hypothetical protein AAGE84_25995 [Cyanobacteria bacterium P01_G01_bin.39]
MGNDTGADTKAKDKVALDHAVIKAIPKITDYDVPWDFKQEQHMMTGKPRILMRRELNSW